MILGVMFVTAIIVCGVESQGRLTEPPGRSTLWRYPDDPLIKPYMSIVEANYNDDELSCGGFKHQQASVGGKCGICGDPWDGERENEAGGTYGKGIIVRQYEQGSWIDITVELTADQKGFFEFRLCMWNRQKDPATQECLDQNLLSFAEGMTKYYVEGAGSPIHHFQTKLPDDLTCEQCVLQWRYQTGNTWGCGENGDCCTGCGPQPEFYGCADVAIGTGPVLAPPDWTNPSE